MSLQQFLVHKFKSWNPSPPAVVSRGTGDITLEWGQERFGFLRDHLLYRIEKNNKIPKWVVVYSGGKTQKRIDDLPPSYPHRFRLRVILKAEAVPRLAALALQHYGNETEVYREFDDDNKNVGNDSDNCDDNKPKESSVDSKEVNKDAKQEDSNKDSDSEGNHIDQRENKVDNGAGDYSDQQNVKPDSDCNGVEKKGGGDQKNSMSDNHRWLESAWSEETWTNTDSVGTSAACFCMAVKCGYLKQVQCMLEERPELVGLVNTYNGFTPLATAIVQGDMTMIRCLLAAGADLEQPSAAGQTALHLAALAGDTVLVELLLDRGADLQARDWNGLRAEHYAVESGRAAMVRVVMDRGGDPHARDHNGWTPLFRAICQGARHEVVSELVSRGSDVDAVDNAGLPLTSVARLLRNRHGQPRESIIRLVDVHYPHEKARSRFTRLSKKIHHLNTMLNLT